ncbi:phage major tail tube protein [uncultured Methylobacterium sp.]|jgi:P2 family phage contractile tail tube protein|uniref:phage major tail tube protein n=1 Tax=uncultured Methylobacterium sp. TaxID=157278 RepID=UPI002624D755|nr:phage major tail tube protein [uncultured Methylobacterium sp.]
MANLRDANILRDFTVWIRDVGMIGESPGFQIPEIKIQTEDFRGGGMFGTAEVPMGVEKVEFEFDLHTWNESVFQEIGFSANAMSVPIMFRGHMVTANGGSTGVYINTLSLVKEIKPAKVSPGKKTELTVSCVANYYQHQVGPVNGKRTITEINVFDNTFFVNGVDLTQGSRQILGFDY